MKKSKWVLGRVNVFWELVNGVRHEWLVDADDFWSVHNELEAKYTGRWDFLEKWGFSDFDDVTQEDIDRLSGEAEEFLF